MAFEDDGDPVRGVGFVTIYAAYLEEQVDQLLELLVKLEAFPADEQRWGVKKKLSKAKRLVAQIAFEDQVAMLADLDVVSDLFEHRNEIVHGRIYGGTAGRPDTLMSGRPNVPDRNVASSELYELAADLDAARNAIYRPMLFQISGALAALP